MGSGVPGPIPIAASSPGVSSILQPVRQEQLKRDHMNHAPGAEATGIADARNHVARSTEVTSATDLATRHAEDSSDKNLQRAEGSCRIVLGGSEKGTRIMDVYQKSPTRVLFPQTGDGRAREAVLVNTSGGVAGGDCLQSTVTALNEASIAITTQAAEKIYGAINESAHITTTLILRDAAKVAWLPQETIVFNRARVHRETQIEVSSGTQLLALEWIVLGRAAHGEKVSAGSISDSFRVRKNGRLVWADTFHVAEDSFPHVSRKALLSDSTAIATLVYFGPDLEAPLQVIRDASSSPLFSCGATLVGGLLVARMAAKCSFELKTGLRDLLQALGKQFAFGPFQVPKMWSC